jgi:alpha-L-fucosidase
MMDPAAVPYAGASGPGIIEALQHGDPNGSVWRPGEADVSIRPGWFYHPVEDSQVRSAENLMDLYRSSVGRNAGLLLNVPPNRDGLLSRYDTASLSEFGRKLRDLYRADVTRRASVDRLTLTFPSAVSFDHLSIEEEIATGQRVSRHAVDIWENSTWRTLIEGSTIGHRRLHRVEPVSTSRVRVRVIESFGDPAISRIQVLPQPS